MRVLYLHTSRTGGAELAAPALAAQLGARLWVRGPGQVADSAGSRGVDVKVLNSVWDRRTSGMRALVSAVLELLFIQAEMVRILRVESPQVVVSNTIQGLLHLAVPCALTRTPLVAYVRDLGRGGNRPPLEVLVYRQLLRWFSKGQIFNSKLTRSSWRLSEASSIVVPTAVSSEFFDVWCGEVGGRGLMLGRIADWKGQRQAILALESVNASHAVSLDLVGGQFFGEVVALPEHSFPLNLTDHVDDPWEWLREAGFVLHASLTPEPFGQVVAQAAAAGVPLICSRDGGHMEWLRDGESCLAVNPLDTVEFSLAVKRLLNNPGEATQRARKARQAAESFRENNAYIGLNLWLDKLEKSK